eukprot:gene13804-22481_t
MFGWKRHDGHFIGVLGREVLGLKECADDVEGQCRCACIADMYSNGGDVWVWQAEVELEALSRTCSNSICILILVPCCVELIVDNNHLLLERTVILVTHTDGKIPLVPLCEQWGTKDPRVNTLRTVLPGLRVVRQDPTECLISFLCSSNNNIGRITLMLDRLRAAYGEKLCTVGEHDMYTFPKMERLAQVEEIELREMGFGYRAAKYVMEQGGSPWLDSLRQKPLAEVRETLQRLHGVGRKVADCVTLFSMDQPSVVPVDTHLKESKSLTPKMHDYVAELFVKQYGGYAGWAHSLLFAAELPKYTKLLPEAMQVEMKAFSDLEKAAKEEARQAAKARKAAKAAAAATVKMEPGLEAGKDGAGGSGSGSSGSNGSSKNSSKGRQKIKVEPEEMLAPPPSTPPPPSAARHANPADMLSPRLAGSPPKRIRVKEEPSDA